MSNGWLEGWISNQWLSLRLLPTRATKSAIDVRAFDELTVAAESEADIPPMSAIDGGRSVYGAALKPVSALMTPAGAPMDWKFLYQIQSISEEVPVNLTFDETGLTNDAAGG